MRKFTLLLASLFLTIGAMAQTFVQPETGKFYKLKGDNKDYPWLTATAAESNGTGIIVSGNEEEAGIFEKTANGLKAVSTGKFIGMTNSRISFVDTEAAIELVSEGDQGKYRIKVANSDWMYNNNTDKKIHESSGLLDIERTWGFIEVESDNNEKVVADGVYIIKNEYNTRGAMAYGTWNDNEYFGLTEITLSGCTGNNLTVDPVSNKYWYVKTTEKGVYIYNIGKKYFLQKYEAEKVTCAKGIANNFVLVERTANNTNYVSVKCGDYYLSYSCGWAPNSTAGSVRWLTSDEAAATLMTFNSVDATAYAETIAEVDNVIAAYEEGNTAAKAELAEAIAQAEALLANITIGDGVGEYSCGGYTEAELESLLGSAKGFYNSIDDETAVATIEAYIELVNETMALSDLNMPAAGKYYAFSCVDGGKYVSSTISGSKNRLTMVSEEDNTTIYYYDGTSLLSYAAGQTINAYDLTAIGETTAVEFTAANKGTVGKYNIRLGERVIYGSGTNIDSGTGNPDNRDGYVWTIKEVTSLPVTITAAKYATFFAPVAVTVPSGVTAHTVTINGEWATLTAIEGGVIPANTGVVLAGEANTYNFAITTTEATAESDLTGTVAATYITADAYVLGYLDNAKTEIGFGKATTDGQAEGTFLNNSHKAYLPMPAGNNVSFYGFRFDEEENTTAIEKVETVTENVIFDLAGRRVSEITEKGIYIIDGRKVLVK